MTNRAPVTTTLSGKRGSGPNQCLASIRVASTPAPKNGSSVTATMSDVANGVSKRSGEPMVPSSETNQNAVVQDSPRARVATVSHGTPGRADCWAMGRRVAERMDMIASALLGRVVRWWLPRA